MQRCVVPLLSAPSALWEYIRSGDASGPVHIAPDCDLHVQNPIPLLMYLSDPVHKMMFLSFDCLPAQAAGRGDSMDR